MNKSKYSLDVLDAEDRSVSVAEARHMARKTMLLKSLDQLFEIGMNVDNKPGDRIVALKYVVEFASEAQGNGTKQITKLSPEAARLIARLGPGGDAGVLPDEAEGAGVGGREGRDSRQPSDDEG